MATALSGNTTVAIIAGKGRDQLQHVSVCTRWRESSLPAVLYPQRKTPCRCEKGPSLSGSHIFTAKKDRLADGAESNSMEPLWVSCMSHVGGTLYCCCCCCCFVVVAMMIAVGRLLVGSTESQYHAVDGFGNRTWVLFQRTVLNLQQEGAITTYVRYGHV